MAWEENFGPEPDPYAEDDKYDDDGNDASLELVLIIIVVILGTILFMIFARVLYKRFCRPSNTPSTLSTIQDHRHAYSNAAFNTQQIVSTPTVHSTRAVPGLPPPYRERIFLPTEPAIQHATPVASTVGNSAVDGGNPMVRPDEQHGHELSGHQSISHDSNESSSFIEEHLFTQFNPSVRDLFIPTERSIKKIVSNKLVVIAAHLVDHLGYTLVLDNMGISLHIPPGAIQVGEKHMISLVLNWDLTDNPDMTDNQSLVSPVVYCGPHGLELRETCTLSYRHCAYDAGDIKILMSDTELTEEKNWSALCDAREEMGQCVVTQEECKIRIDHFSLFTSIQDRPSSSPGKKWLQLAVFTCPLKSTLDHFQVRIYFLNKTPCALEWAIQNEAALGARKCCPEKIFLFNGTGEDMILSLAYLSEKWESIDGNIALRTSFLSVWHGHCPYAAMCFKRQRTPGRRAEEINIHFLAQQDGQDNQQERLIIHMTEDRTAGPRDTAHCCNNPLHGPSSVRVIVQDPSGAAVDVAIGPSEEKCSQQIGDFVDRGRFPEDLKTKLTSLLDPPAQLGKDWRDLASKLALDQVIPFLECNRTSPTLLLLQHMEEKGAHLGRLYEILEGMGRHDASLTVRHCLESVASERAWTEGGGYMMDSEGREWSEGRARSEGRTWSEPTFWQHGANILGDEDNGRQGEENQDSVFEVP